MAEIKSESELLHRLRTQLNHEWQRFRGIEGNDTAIGGSYEDTLADILTKYFRNVYDFRTNCSIMDSELNCFDVFDSSSQNEVDVLALFQQAKPKTIVEEGEVSWVPLEAIAFLCESKSRLDKGRLKSDLDKLSKLRTLEIEPDERFPTSVTGKMTSDRQIHSLVYDQASIADDTLTEILNNHSEDWDLILLVEDDVAILNNSLPYGRNLNPAAGNVANKGSQPSHFSIDDGLVWFILCLKASIPVPLSFNGVSAPLVELANAAGSSYQQGGHTSISDTDIE